MTANTTSQEFFEQKYLIRPDPWEFASSPYEQDRYAVIFKALNHRRYERAFEPGCSIGVLTQRLATICEHVEATDISPTAVKFAQERCANLSNVNITCRALSTLLPNKSFDLIILSEVGYYFEQGQLLSLAEGLVRGLCNSGILLAAHWLGTSRDHLISGDRVHEILSSLDGLTLEHSERHARFRLDRWACR